MGKIGRNYRLLIDYLRPLVRREFEFVVDRPPAVVSARRIPNMLYQTGESRLLDVRHLAEVNRFRELNPDLGFSFFDANDRDNYMMESWSHRPIFDVYRRSEFKQMKADIFRYCILFERGGYYLDINKACMVQLSSLHSDVDEALISFESNDCNIPPPLQAVSFLDYPEKYVVQWSFGFAAGHPLLEQMIKSVEAYSQFFSGRIFPNPKLGVLMFTATGMFTSVVRNYVAENSSEKIAQAGIDFNRSLIFRLRGSRNTVPPTYGHYSEATDMAILSGDS